MIEVEVSLQSRCLVTTYVSTASVTDPFDCVSDTSDMFHDVISISFVFDQRDISNRLSFWNFGLRMSKIKPLAQ